MAESGILSAVEAVYAAAGAPELWPDALDAIAVCFRAVGTVLILQKSDGSVATVVSPALTDSQREYDDSAWKLDCMADRLMEQAMLGERGCYTERQLATPEEIATHPFFTDFRARFGLGSVMATVLQPHPRLPVIVSVQGGRDRPTFSDEDLVRHQDLSRHVEKALQLTIRLLDAETGQLVFADALSRLSCGAFVLDQTGRVLFHNAYAERFIGGQMSLVDGRLTVDGGECDPYRDACRIALEDKSVHTSGTDQTLIVKGPEHGRVVLHVVPLGQGLMADRGFTTARIVVLAVDHPTTAPADPSLVRDLFGLTLAEARLASLVGSGQSPRDAAGLLNITEATARSVLKSVFLKTGVSRQSELAALVSGIPLKP